MDRPWAAGIGTARERRLSLILTSAMAGSVLLILAVTRNPLLAAGSALAFLVLPLTQGVVEWRTLLSGYLAILLLIPARAYNLPAASWFDVSPQRIALFAVLLLWGATLLADPASRLRPSGFGVQLLALFFAALLSLLVNSPTLAEDGRFDSALKGMASLAAFMLAFLFASSIGSSPDAVRKVLRWIVVLGGVLSVFAIVERLTGYRLFYHLDDFIPILQRNATFYLDRIPLSRGGGLRVFGSSEHPIAFGALLAMVWPFSLHFAVAAKGRARYVYLATSVAILFALLLTVSRTAIVGVAMAFVVLFARVPRYRVALLSLASALAVVAALAAPEEVSGIGAVMSPRYLIEREFSTSQVTKTASGEWIHMGRGFAYIRAAREVERRPLLGMGYDMLEPERFFYTDNQFEKLLIELGALGIGAFLWLTLSLIVRFWKAARIIPGDLAGLVAAIAASCAAFTSMSLGYDTLGFPQTAFLFFIVAGLGAGLVRVCMSERAAET